MFSEFGAPIIEGFDNHDFEPAPNCYMEGDTVMCPRSSSNDNNNNNDTSSSSDSDTSDEEENQNRVEESNERETEPDAPEPATPSPSPAATTQATESDNEEGVSSEEEDDEEDEETTETFYGGNIEHFSNKEVVEKATSMNLILKGVMITCLFYVLAHKDTKKYIMGKVFKSVSSQNYLYIAMVLFFLVYYIISVLL